jgi:DNA-binding response OmpR family regulator
MKKVLLVDDSNTVLMMERMVLKKRDYQILTASNGEEGVRRALAERPDVILMDVIMPEMNGFEACRRLRQEEATKNIPIIMVTTRGESANVETGFESGCNDYITKPVDALELLAKLRDQLGE